MKTKITYIISNVNKALAYEWISTYLNKDKFQLDFILLNPGDSELESFLKESNLPVERVTYNGKTDLLSALLKTYRLLKKNRSAIIHTHLFDASLIGLTAGRMAGVKKRIYTRHHSDYHHEYYPHAIKYDKFINFMATDIVAITQVVKDILIKKEFVHEKKIHLIHHGFLLEDFINPSPGTVNKLKQNYNPNNQYPVIGMISRYIHWKGLQYSIPAFEKLLKTYPDALLILANAKGDYKKEIAEMLSRIPKRNCIEIEFESDIFALYQLFDTFIHVPITHQCEAFGQTYVEALGAGVPSVFTLSGIANDFIIDHHNAVVVPYKNTEAIFEGTLEILKDKALRDKLIINGRKDILTRFNLQRMINALEDLYAN